MQLRMFFYSTGFWIAFAAMSPLSAQVLFVPGPAAGPPPYDFSNPQYAAATGINNAGVAVGNSTVTNFAQLAARWSVGGSAILPARSPSPPNGGPGFSTVGGISDAGISFGASRLYGPTGNYIEQVGMIWAAPPGSAWSEPEAPTPPAGGRSRAMPTAISASGYMAGESSAYSSAGLMVASPIVRWAPGQSAPVVLDSHASGGKQYAKAVNDRGTVVGYVNPNGASVAARWLGGETTFNRLQPINTANTRNGAVAYDVNARDVAVGTSDRYEGTSYRGTRATRWDANSNAGIELNHLQGSSTDGHASSSALFISDGGDIAGTSAKFDGTTSLGTFPVRWNAGGTTPTELQTLGVASGVTVGGINRRGTIVGSLSKAGVTGTRAVLWHRDGTAVLDLNDLVPPASNWTVTAASAISDTGWIAGLGTFDPDGAGTVAAYRRLFSLLVPDAGTYGQGDANFDARVNFSDLVVLAQNYNQPNASLSVNVGDFDLSGTTNFADLVALAKHYNTGPETVAALGATFSAEWALAQSIVPEPAALSMLAIGAAATARRRRA